MYHLLMCVLLFRLSLDYFVFLFFPRSVFSQRAQRGFADVLYSMCMDMIQNQKRTEGKECLLVIGGGLFLGPTWSSGFLFSVLILHQAREGVLYLLI